MYRENLNLQAPTIIQMTVDVFPRVIQIRSEKPIFSTNPELDNLV